VNLDMAIRATGILRILVVRWTSRLVGAHAVVNAVARQAQLVNASKFQQSGISRAMRRMAGRASVGLEWRVLVSKRTLLVGVTLYARCIRAGCESCLLELETAVRIVTITALHRAFEDLVMERLVEIRLYFVMTIYAELRLADLE
jgi:hypothetical protein